MASFYKAPTSNYWSTTLNGAINDSVDTITLTSTTGLQSPGVIVIDREDGGGDATAGAREVVHYTGVSGNDLTGCTRGEENSTARSHNDGALVEAVFTVEQWNDLRDAVAATISTDGANIAITGTASIAALDALGITGAVVATTSIASIARVETAQLISTANTLTNLAVTSTASIARVEATSVLAGTASITTGNMATGNITTIENTNEVTTGTASISELRYKVAKPAWVTDTDGATITFNMDEGNVHKVTLGGNRTLAVSNVDPGQSFVITLIQDGTGSRTVTWFSDINWDNITAPTLTTTAGRADVFGFLALDSNDFYGFVLGQNHPT